MTDLIERDLELDADPAAVWRAITDPAWLREWLAEEAELELWPGGEARFTVDGLPRSGWVEEVSPPVGDGPARSGRLTFWWQLDGEAEEPASRVCMELTETAQGTRVRVTEARPLEVLDLVGIPVRDAGGRGGARFGPALIAA